jgi:hypothetical protein
MVWIVRVPFRGAFVRLRSFSSQRGSRSRLTKPIFCRDFNGSLRFVAFWWVLFSILFGNVRADPAENWRPTTWDGEAAWEAASAGWMAIVSEGRARLVSIAPVGSGDNLLFASSKASISWGGHRCWLGPQAEWKGIWPPPHDWEASAAAAVKAHGPILTVTLPHTDTTYPALTRSYEWRAGVLHCRFSWKGERHHAIQILQLPQWAILRIQRIVRPDLPLGYALLPISGRTTMTTQQPMAPGVGRIEGNEVTLWHANVTEKIAFARQELRAELGTYQLKMRPGNDDGMAASAPNLGLLTQVYLGDWQNPFVELEQLSPFGGNGAATSEILIEPVKPSRNTGQP